jgi:hypothetical protein
VIAGAELVEAAQDLGVAAQEPCDEHSQQTDGHRFDDDELEQPGEL